MNDSSPLRSPRSSSPAGSRRTEPLRKVTVGKREVFTSGLAPSFWSDIYHGAMTVGWPAFLGALAAAFVVINAGFALLYALVPDSIANAHGKLLQLFFFSVETLTTVGYGEFYPQGNYGHVVDSVETFVGLFFTASMLGLIFARVSRPRARLLFTRFLTVGPYEGRPTLYMRVANARLNVISSASARLWLLTSEETAEGVGFRRFHELQLVRSENPTFVLSWTILHTIDESSPLFGLSQTELVERDAFLILSITGHDDTSAQTVHGRETYYAQDIRWDHRFVDVLGKTEDGSTLLDYARFHEIEPIAEGSPGEPAGRVP